MLYPDPIPLQTIIILNCCFRDFFLAGNVEEGISRALLIITTYYYSMLHQLMLHCYFMLNCINCWLFSSDAARTD